MGCWRSRICYMSKMALHLANAMPCVEGHRIALRLEWIVHHLPLAILTCRPFDRCSCHSRTRTKCSFPCSPPESAAGIRQFEAAKWAEDDDTEFPLIPGADTHEVDRDRLITGSVSLVSSGSSRRPLLSARRCRRFPRGSRRRRGRKNASPRLASMLFSMLTRSECTNAADRHQTIAANGDCDANASISRANPRRPERSRG